MRSGNAIKTVSYIVVFVVFFAIIVKISINYMDTNSYHSRIYNGFVDSMSMKLVMENPIPASISKEDSKNTTLIYVLGGNQDSLISRFRKASNLYHQGLSHKILILNRPGITEYNQELGRNLTNNEWAVGELQKVGVRKEDVEPVSVEEKLFGTLAEARYLTHLVRNKGCRGLILVTSDYHTRRAFETFSAYASGRSPEIYIYGAGNPAGLPMLFAEYIKLSLYERFLIPLYLYSEMNH